MAVSNWWEHITFCALDSISRSLTARVREIARMGQMEEAYWLGHIIDPRAVVRSKKHNLI